MKTSSCLIFLGALALSACTAQPLATTEAPAAPTEPPEAKLEGPEIINYTPFPNVLLSGRCADYECASPVEYFSWGAKISFDFDQRGRLKLSEQQEPSLDMNDAEEQDLQCGEKGATFNQRTIWFPYTAIFVRGGTLQSVKDAAGAVLKQRPLGEIQDGKMAVIGKAAREIEYSYVPCVGKYQVSAGVRLDGFLPYGARLFVKPKTGKNLGLSLPDPTEPWVLLRYQSGAMIPVPMRPTMVTVDMVERRLVVYYQSTFPVAPPLRKIELRAILPDQIPSQDETTERYRERTEATLRDLRQCQIPQRPMEPCATPDRLPDRRIFSP